MSEINKNASKAAIDYIKSQRGRKELIEKFASLDIYPRQDRPYTIFLAGSPGAGKTEVSRKLIETLEQPIIHIYADAIRSSLEQYKGSNADTVQGACALGVEKLLDHVLHHNQHFY